MIRYKRRFKRSKYYFSNMITGRSRHVLIVSMVNNLPCAFFPFQKTVDLQMTSWHQDKFKSCIRLALSKVHVNILKHCLRSFRKGLLHLCRVYLQWFLFKLHENSRTRFDSHQPDGREGGVMNGLFLSCRSTT